MIPDYQTLKLGVDQIYVQAKRYAETNKVQAGDIRDFCGALNLHKASKGIFFTTSKFTKSAIETAKNMSTKIVLIDDEKLAQLMIDYDIGCRTKSVVKIKRLDEDFFDF